MKSIAIGSIVVLGLAVSRVSSAEGNIPLVPPPAGNSSGEIHSSTGCTCPQNGKPSLGAAETAPRQAESNSTGQNGEKEKQRAITQAATALRRKLKVVERELRGGEVEINHKAEDLVALVPSLVTMPENAEEARTEIESISAAELASPNANKTGWFSHKRTAEAERLRQLAQANKEAAMRKLVEIEALDEKLKTIRSRVAKLREQCDVLETQSITIALERARAAGVIIPWEDGQAVESK